MTGVPSERPEPSTTAAVSAEVQQRRWSTEGFLRAWEAGAFDDARVEVVDVWVRPPAAEPQRSAAARTAVWDPADVLLVVEVGDERLQADLTTRAGLHAAAGAAHWTVSRDGVHEHTGPTALGCRGTVEHWPGDHLAVPCAEASLDVAALVGADG